MILSKDDRGFGISSLKAENIGLIMKWVWQLRTEKEALWCKVILGWRNLVRKPRAFLVKKNLLSVWKNISKVFDHT